MSVLCDIKLFTQRFIKYDVGHISDKNVFFTSYRKKTFFPLFKIAMKILYRHAYCIKIIFRILLRGRC